MEALIVILVMHCGVPEAVIIDSPVRLSASPIAKEARERVLEQFDRAKADGAQTAKVNVEDATGETCKVST